MRAPCRRDARSRSAPTTTSPADSVWTVLEPIESHVDWMADAEVDPLRDRARPRGVGTRFECVTAVGPIRLTDRMEITEWEPGRAMGVRHDGLVTGTGRFSSTPLDGGRRTPVHVGRGADVPVVARRPPRRADRWAAGDAADLARQPQPAQATRRTSAVTAAPSTITTTSGARRHAAIAATPTPTARASRTRSLPVENVFWTTRARDQRGRDEGEAALDDGRELARPDHDQPGRLAGVGADAEQQHEGPAHGTSRCAGETHGVGIACGDADQDRRRGAQDRHADGRERDQDETDRPRRAAPASRPMRWRSCGATMATKPAGKAASRP